MFGSFSGAIPEQSGSWILSRVALLCLLAALGAGRVGAQKAATKAAAEVIGAATPVLVSDPAPGCFRPAEGAEVPEPEDLRSVNGLLKVDLAFRSYVDARGERRYCYVTMNGGMSPTLRAKPGDTVILNFKNEAAAEQSARTVAAPGAGHHNPMTTSGGAAAAANGMPGASCANGAMTPASTN